MKRADGLVYKPHTTAESVQWDSREGRGHSFGEQSYVSVVRRECLDALLAVLDSARLVAANIDAAKQWPLSAVSDAIAAFDDACAEELVSSDP